jgi:hypothetical protein
MVQQITAKAMSTSSEAGTPSYLEPNSGSMQKPVGSLFLQPQKRGGRVAIGWKTRQNHAASFK